MAAAVNIDVTERELLPTNFLQRVESRLEILLYPAGFWTLQHFLRPLRFTLAIAMAPAFDRVIVFLQKLTGWNKRNAFGLYLVLFGSITSLLVFGSIFVFGGPQAFSRG